MYDELTRGDVQKMQEEIDYRTQVLRPKLIEDVQTARAFGDLSENFEYKCAKQEKNRNDSRIRYLQRMIKTARIIDDRSGQDTAGLYDTVEIFMENTGKSRRIQLVTTLRQDALKGLISKESPVGKAVLGRRAGDRVQVDMGAAAATGSPSAPSKKAPTTAPSPSAAFEPLYRIHSFYCRKSPFRPLYPENDCDRMRKKEVCPMRKHLSLMLLLLLMITCTACGQRQTVQRMAADRITQAESVSQLQEVSDLIVVFTPESQENVLSYFSDGNVSGGYTRTTGTVLQVLKGEPPEQLVITEECYLVDNVLWTQGGYLPMQEGESYLLFLTAYDRDSVYAGMYFPTELEKGKYPLTDEPLTASDSADAWEVYVIEGDDLHDYQDWYQQITALYPELF